MPNAAYRVVRRLSPGLVVLASKYGEQLFLVGRLRKPTMCAMTGVPLGIGDRAWRTVNGNTPNRMHRLAVGVADA